jgi:hypothetical protein
MQWWSLSFFVVECLWCIALIIVIFMFANSKIRSRLLLMIFIVGIGAGLLGLFSAYKLTWSPSPTIRCLGFPFPAMLWQREGNEWVDYVGTPLTAVMDVAFFIAVATLPLLTWTVIGHIRKRSSIALP